METRNIFTFEAEVKALAAALDAKIGKVLENIALDLHSKFVLANPVDTGHSQANWRINLDTPDTTVRTGVFGPQLPEVVDYNSGKNIYITNPVDYVQWLNEGTSKQAPAGFIQAAIAQVETKVDSYVQQARDAGFPG